METFILILVLYWFITTLIAVGILYDTSEQEAIDHVVYMIISVILACLLGWLVVPMIIGRSLQFTYEIKENTKKEIEEEI
jgi:hypothetical protein